MFMTILETVGDDGGIPNGHYTSTASVDTIVQLNSVLHKEAERRYQESRKAQNGACGDLMRHRGGEGIAIGAR